MTWLPQNGDSNTFSQNQHLPQDKHLARDNSFESCIKCTVCTTYCPVAKVNPLYPGPKQAGPDGERLRLKDPALYDDALKYCTNCKRCEVACPSDVKIGDIIQRAKASYSSNKPKLRDAILSHTDIMGTLSTPFAPIVNAVTGLKPVRALLDKALKIDHRRELPKYSFGTFRRWYRKQAEKQQQYSEQVAFFHGCFVNYNHPQLGKDLVSVFNAMNIGVQLLKREKCCGVPLIANGFIEQAKKQARVNLESLTDAVIGRDIPVVATSSSCTFTLRDEYPHLLDVDTAPVRDKVELATRYLYRLLDQGRDLPLKPLFSANNTPLRIAYHTPCHMEKMGWTAYTQALLQRILVLNWWYSTLSVAGLPELTVLNQKTTQHRKGLAPHCSSKSRRVGLIW